MMLGFLYWTIFNISPNPRLNRPTAQHYYVVKFDRYPLIAIDYDQNCNLKLSFKLKKKKNCNLNIK